VDQESQILLDHRDPLLVVPIVESLLVKVLRTGESDLPADVGQGHSIILQ
jgi:hypothetical protein